VRELKMKILMGEDGSEESEEKKKKRKLGKNG
jgi:hypothetical protein